MIERATRGLGSFAPPQQPKITKFRYSIPAELRAIVVCPRVASSYLRSFPYSRRYVRNTTPSPPSCLRPIERIMKCRRKDVRGRFAQLSVDNYEGGDWWECAMVEVRNLQIDIMVCAIAFSAVFSASRIV